MTGASGLSLAEIERLSAGCGDGQPIFFTHHAEASGFQNGRYSFDRPVFALLALDAGHHVRLCSKRSFKSLITTIERTYALEGSKAKSTRLAAAGDRFIRR